MTKMMWRAYAGALAAFAVIASASPAQQKAEISLSRGLLTVIVIGLVVENLIFRTIERNTVQKWGTQS
jgi:hypothetical protein